MERRLHASRVERTWRPVGSTGARWWQRPRSCRARVTLASERRLEVLHMGWWLHVRCMEAGRQVARVGAAAGVVGTQRWRSASARGRNSAQVRTCKPVIGWARIVYASVALGRFQNRAGPH
jgi:hypothetical protein